MTSCINPTRAFKNPEGGTPLFNPDGNLHLSCGKCHNCLKIRSTQWATRVKHELSEHPTNCFITLTYSDNTVPTLSEFKQRILFTKFIKRLRKKLHPTLIKYFASHEYGTQTARPHHHLIIFNYCPPNWKHHSTSKRGNKQYISQELSNLWTHGHSTVGPATPGSAYYIASYALKSKHHEHTNPHTGEYSIFKDKMTASQSLGFNFLIKNQDHLIQHTYLPRYYQKIIKERQELEQNPHTWHNMKLSNRLKKLQLIKPLLHEQYQLRIEQLNSQNLTPQEKLASLEISDSLNNIHTELRNPSSIDEKNKSLHKEHLRNLAEINHGIII